MTALTDFRETLALAVGSEYDILDELGRGGSSVVFHARDRVLGREVAIKLIRGMSLDDPEAGTRFEREARMLARLQHPNIVMLYAAKQLPGGSLALVMQHSASWRTLKALVRDGGPLPVEKAERILRDLAAALGYLHDNHIVHRDIKPENIFVETESGQALLADFGIAKPQDGQASVTLTGVVIGTPAYMSPEQIDGAGVTGQSDLYSLGMVGYEMLTGRRPWAGESLYGVIFRQKTDRLPSLEGIRPDVSDRLRLAIERATEKDPADRWPHAHALLAHLESSDAPHLPVVASVAPAFVTAPAVVATAAPSLHEPEVPAWAAGYDSPSPEEVRALVEETFAAEPPVRAHRRGRNRVGILAAVVMLFVVGAGAVAMIGPEADVITPTGAVSLEAATVPEALPDARVPVAADSTPVEVEETVPSTPVVTEPESPRTPAPAVQRAPTPAPQIDPTPAQSTVVARPDPVESMPAPAAPRVSTATLEAPASAPVVRSASATRASAAPTVLPQLRNGQEFASGLLSSFFAPGRMNGFQRDTLKLELAVLVNEQGRVTDSRINSGSGFPAFDRAVIRAAEQMRFSASPNRNVPSEVWVVLPLTFNP